MKIAANHEIQYSLCEYNFDLYKEIVNITNIFMYGSILPVSLPSLWGGFYVVGLMPFTMLLFGFCVPCAIIT